NKIKIIMIKTKEGFLYILLVVDSFSKWTEAFPMRTQEAKEVADILYNEIFTRYGAPRTIVSDRGRNFMSKLVNALCEFFEVKRLHTSSYHPQTNATVERANGTLAQTLRAYVDKDQMNWPSLLPSIMMAFRSTPCTESTGFSPYQLLFGKEMHLPIDTSLIPKPTLSQNVRQYFENLIERLKTVKEIAKSNLENAQSKAKATHDTKAEPPTFQVGDLVMMKLGKVATGLSSKLESKWVGPFRIMDIGPNFTYKLKNIQDNKIQKSPINASRLKLYHERQEEVIDRTQGNQQPDMPQPPELPGAYQQQPQNQPPLQINTPRPDGGGSQDEDKNNQPASQDSKSNAKQSQQTHQHENKDMTDIRIIHASRKGGKQRYRIQWPDGSKAWEPEQNVPKQAIDTYLKTYTKVGRKRKHQPKFFTRSDD
ncbi:MAG: transposase family protein, partial [Candidatus Thiodiazotropha sp.]